MPTNESTRATAAPEHCTHSWHDFGQLGGRNVTWCPRCDTLAWAGKEPEISQPVQQHSGNTDSTGRDSMLREAAKLLLDRYDEMREKKGAPVAAEFELLRAGLSSEPAPVARELDVKAERREFELWVVRERVPYCDTPADRAQQFIGWLAARRAAPAPVRTEQAAEYPHNKR